MRKLKLLLVAGALLLGAGQTWAQTDVTSTYITNADFSSTDGWTPYVSSTFRDYGNGLIGTYGVRTAEGQGVSTVDATHLATEYCFGFEVRWQTNYASYNQETIKLPVGAYTLTFDVENTNSKTTKATYNNLFYVQVGETKYTDSSTEWMNGKSSWTTHTISFNITEASTATISLGYGTGSNNYGSANTPTLHVSHLKLTWTDLLQGAKLAWQEAKTAAETALGNAAYASVTGSEKTALQAEIDKVEPTTIDGYNAATEALTTATSAFTAAAPAYNELVTEIAYAKTIGVDTETAEAAQNAQATAATITTATQTLKVLEYSTINETYPNDVTSLLGTWSGGDYGTTSGEGYSGSESYFDKWNGSAMDLTSSNATTLPAGKYTVMVAGRGVSTTTMSLSVKVGEAEAVSTPFLLIGNTGKGIDTKGATNFSDGGTYSNNNNGRGWQYRYITFETDGKAEVTIAINGHLNNGTWQSFYAPVLLCDDATFTAAEKAAVVEELRALLAEGDELVEKYKNNYGDGVFQIPTTAYSTFKGKVATGHTFDNETAIAGVTVEQLKQAKELVENGIAAFKATVLNAPAEGKLYNLVVATENHPKIGNAVIIIPGATSNNNPTGYGMNANFAINPNLNQAVTFTKVNGNNYNISFTTAGGTTYLTYGTLNGSAAGWKDSQIQATTDAEKKGEFLIAASATANAFNIINTITNSTIACQTGGNIYTEDGNADFTVAETQKPTITIGAEDGGYATTMVPFAVDQLPNGLKAYSCAEVAENVLTLEEVQSLKANKPYIVEGTATELTGYAQGTDLTYTEGILTGVYTNTDAPVGSYVLQELNNVVGFYKVEESKQPNVTANHAYLTVSASTLAGVRAFFFPGGTTTGISTLQMLLDGNCEFYDLNGVRTQQLQKGMNIIRTQDGTTRKIMVK